LVGVVTQALSEHAKDSTATDRRNNNG
jgi:hypothetical protein